MSSSNFPGAPSLPAGYSLFGAADAPAGADEDFSGEDSFDEDFFVENEHCSPAQASTSGGNGGVFSFANGANSTAGAGVDLTLGAPDKFPIADFPALLRAVAEELAKVYQTPVCMPAMSAIAALSGSTGQ